MWLIPILPPLFLNLASNNVRQQEIGWQYLSTSGPFLAFAAVAGFAALKLSPRMKCAALVIILVVASGSFYLDRHAMNTRMDHQAGKTSDLAIRQAAVASIPKGAAVSAGFEFDTHFADRKLVYEFPNPFVPHQYGNVGTVKAVPKSIPDG